MQKSNIISSVLIQDVNTLYKSHAAYLRRIGSRELEKKLRYVARAIKSKQQYFKISLKYLLSIHNDLTGFILRHVLKCHFTFDRK